MGCRRSRSSRLPAAGARNRSRLRDQLGRFWCAPCLEENNRCEAVKNAPEWIAAAFFATKREQRARLYKMLAAAFHPDQGGDPDLMIALNAVRERFST